MAKISKPDANPILALILSFFFQLGHLIVNGQQRKFIFVLIASLLGTLACCIGNPIIVIMGMIKSPNKSGKLIAFSSGRCAILRLSRQAVRLHCFGLHIRFLYGRL